MYKYVNLSIVALQREIQFLRFTGEKKKKRWCTESWLTAELTELFSPVHPWRCISRQAFVKPTLKRQKVFQTRDSWTEEKCVAVSLDPPKPAWGAPRVWCRAQAQRYPFISSSCITDGKVVLRRALLPPPSTRQLSDEGPLSPLHPRDSKYTHLHNTVIPDLEKHPLLSQPSTPPVAISLNSAPLPDTIYMARQTVQVFCHPEVQEMFNLMNTIKLIS